ncbi:MAG: NAD(+) kinase [Gammaproteobacteria bacterium]|nr:NAD(+) kinase [Gammaproteobacteria bacterium]
MAITFKTIGIIGRVRNSGVKETLNALVNYLCESGVKVIIESETAESLTDSTLPTIARGELGKHCDLLIVVGGDGSLLNAAHAVVDHETPVLGINRGSLGFLTDILPTELDKIKSILQGEYKLEKRFLLSSHIELNGKLIGQGDALNEVAVIPNVVPHMLEFEIYIDDQFVCSQNSDGLIVATPTGSTAYALSGGGPILHPQLDAIVLVPMFPHTLSSRPIVIEANQRITIIISPNDSDSSARLTCDGQAYITTPANSRITIQKKTKQLHLIHPLDYNYYETLRSKLHWGKKLH